MQGKRVPKAKKCKACKEPFTPMNSMAKACSPACAIKLSRENQRKEYDKVTRARKKAIKSRSEWLKEAQIEFNKYIRARDSMAGRPCISCQRHHEGQYHAGHYKTVGAHPELRFNEFQVHAQCAPCNNHLSGNIIEYRKGLVERIGLPLVEWLEQDHPPVKYTVDELQWLKAFYKARTKEILES